MLIKSVSAPCLNCEERHTACHDGCDAYKEYKAQIDSIRAKFGEDAVLHNQEAESRYRRKHKRIRRRTEK